MSEADDIIHIKSGAGAAVSVNREGPLYCGRGKAGASGTNYKNHAARTARGKIGNIGA